MEGLFQVSIQREPERIMATPIPESFRPVTIGDLSGVGKAYCKCGEGWTCVVTRTEGPDEGKAFFKCGDNCTCIIGTSAAGELKVKQIPDGSAVGDAFCKCGEGWTCVISKTEELDTSKAFFECAGNCTCEAS